tara:strand:+ start:494 stop:1045 length:552 start_codon:yes stop_codon:yes gene_type:complete
MFNNKGVATTLIVVIILGIAFIAIGGYIFIKNKGEGGGLLGGGKVGGDCGTVVQVYDENYEEEYELPDFELDESRVCMGKSLLKDCTEAKMTMEGTDYDGDYKTVYSIKKINGECRIKFEYGFETGDPLFLECPVKSLTESSMFYFAKDKDKYPGTYINAVYTTLTLFLGGFDESTGCISSIM